MAAVRIFTIIAFYAYAAHAAPAFAADPAKVALIITNQTYAASLGRLDNTHRDGERMARTLTALGFKVVHKRDLDRSAMQSEVSAYVGRLAKAGENAVGFFYYSGHGAANSKYGENYLIPVGADIETDAQLPLAGVKLGELVDAIAATPAKTNFVVFDACRNVPISFSVKSVDKGLRREPQRKGMLVAFATDPGKTATDEGVFAQALADEMQKPGVEATQVFRAVRRRVLDATGERQFPWTAEGLVTDHYFVPAEPQVALVAPPKVTVPRVSQGTRAPVTDCDVLAASKYDQDRLVAGVDYAKIDVEKAIPACEAAMIKYPDEMRFVTWLGRVAYKAKDYTRAMNLYRKAAAADQPAAIHGLSVAYREG